MNRFSLAAIALLVALNGCIEHIDLKPFTLPDLVNASVRKVECFDEYGTAFIATDQGVLLRYDAEQITFNAANFSILNEIQWSDSRVLYAQSTQVFWVIEGEHILQFSPVTFEFYEDTTEFFQPTKFYFDYAISPQGNLYRSGYYKEEWDGGFDTDYFIALYRFQGFATGMWEEIETDMSTVDLNNPSMCFADGKLYIATNPQFIVSNYDSEPVEFQPLGKQGNGFDYESMTNPYISPQGVMYGFDRTPSSFNPLNWLYASGTLDNIVTRVQLNGLCDYREDAQGLIKLLDWKESTARFYVQYYSNPSSEDKSILGYILEYNAETGDCILLELESSEALRVSDPINDVDILDNYVYLGTRDELLVYDLQTKSIDPYISILFEEYNQ